MPAPKARVDDAALIVVDLQPTFLSGIFEKDRVLARSRFLIRVAKLLSVPIFATEQYPSRMGGSESAIAAELEDRVYSKMSFSCCGCGDFTSALAATGRRQAVMVGIETHICVSQTAVDLLNQGFEVIVCPDSVSSRTLEMHKLGMERMRDAGAWPLHTESVAYEWMETAEHPRFRDVLRLVKESVDA